MTNTQIKYFLKAAENCNFHQSAEELFVSQQALSKQIQALEKELGFPLFNRNHKKLSLTEAGAYLARVWLPCVEIMTDSVEKARAMSEEHGFRIGIPDIPRVLDLLVPHMHLISDLHNEEYVIASIINILDQFQKGLIDIMIVFQSDIIHMQGKYKIEVLQKMNYGVICNMEHPLATKEVVRLADLKNEVICYMGPSYVKNMFQDIQEQFSSHEVINFEGKSYVDWRNMQIALHRNAGVTLTYEAFLPFDEEHLKFIPLSEADEKPIHNLVAVCKKDSCMELIERIKTILIDV